MVELGGKVSKDKRIEIYARELSGHVCHINAQEVIRRECRAERMGIKNESEEVSQATQECKQREREKEENSAMGLRKACGR